MMGSINTTCHNSQDVYTTSEPDILTKLIAKQQIWAINYLQNCVSAEILPPLNHFSPHMFCFFYIKLPRLQKSEIILIKLKTGKTLRLAKVVVLYCSNSQINTSWPANVHTRTCLKRPTYDLDNLTHLCEMSITKILSLYHSFHLQKEKEKNLTL